MYTHTKYVNVADYASEKYYEEAPEIWQFLWSSERFYDAYYVTVHVHRVLWIS